jgi:5-methylcytosine-specific restriction endonuclease McrA
LTEEEWTDFLQRSDNPEVLVMPEKAFHRKIRFEISGAVQQKIWVADNYRCVYCGAYMGKAQLTIDHFTPLELGGVNNTSNYLSACRRCNKSKGSMNPHDWCNLKGLKYDYFIDYLKKRNLP